MWVDLQFIAGKWTWRGGYIEASSDNWYGGPGTSNDPYSYIKPPHPRKLFYHPGTDGCATVCSDQDQVCRQNNDGDNDTGQR